MPSKKVLTPIIPGATYHIFNRGNNHEKVFIDRTDYDLFLVKFRQYMTPVADVFAYALLPNHYHLLLWINEDIEGMEFSHQFKRFILSYTNLINKRENRSGNLFLNVFKRLRVTEKDYLMRLLFYIHFNPQKHKVLERFQDYDYSSFKSLISNLPTLLKREEVLSWFDGREGFIAYHKNMQSEEVLKHLIME